MDIAARVRQLLESLREPAVAPFLADWPHSPRRRAVQPAHLPVLRWIPAIALDRRAFGGELVAAVCQAAAALAWRQTYAPGEIDAGFLDDYGWSEIVGGNGPVASQRIACGLLLLGPSTHYPRHRHDAEEIYLPLSGAAEWQQGDAVWRERPPGTVIRHASGEPHAMRTGAGPLLALYLWRGANLAQKAQLDAGSGS